MTSDNLSRPSGVCGKQRQYHISEGRDVVVTYGCHLISTDPPVVSYEHKRARLFGPDEVPGLVMPEGYKRSIAAWFASLNGHAAP